MKYIKILVLLAVATVALMAFTGPASATTITSPTGTTATPTIHLVSIGHIKIATPFGNIECALTLEGKIESHGSGVTAQGKFSTVDWTGCTNGWHLTTVNAGSFILHWTSGYNGTLTFTGTKLLATKMGFSCVYETNNTSIGSFTGGSPAAVTIAASIPINTSESSGLCGTSAAKTEGKLESTSAFYIDQ